MLVICGTQRSGTSLIAKALIESGFDLGTEWFDEEVQGGFEWPPACWFFRTYLGDPTFPFDDLPIDPTQGGKYKNFEFTHELEGQLVCKFSYLMMNPVFVYIWHKFRPNDTLLMLRRDAEAVCLSKAQHGSRFSHDSRLLKQSESYLRYNVRMSLKVIRKLYPHRARTLLFPEEMDLETINLDLLALDPRVQITQEAWDRVYDPSKIHIR